MIFFLDQCGYAKILPSTIRTISQQLLHAEFIVNFAIEWLVDFIADDGDFRKRFAGLGLDGYTSADAILKAKQEGSVHWKYLVESQIGPAFRRAAGIPFFSPFYIEPADGHRGYWLLHLAPHERARSAMIDVYWGNANSHKHFGHTGLNMLAYKTEVDQTGYLNGISFDDLTRSVVKSNLLQDFARVIRESHVDGVTFEDFAKKYTNQTMANRALMREVMGELAIKSELTITGPKGGKKRNGAVADADVISPCNQLWLPSFCARR